MPQIKDLEIIASTEEASINNQNLVIAKSEVNAHEDDNRYKYLIGIQCFRDYHGGTWLIRPTKVWNAREAFDIFCLRYQKLKIIAEQGEVATRSIDSLKLSSRVRNAVQMASGYYIDHVLLTNINTIKYYKHIGKNQLAK